jgi:hypothetical protein
MIITIHALPSDIWIINDLAQRENACGKAINLLVRTCGLRRSRARFTHNHTDEKGDNASGCFAFIEPRLGLSI